MSNGPPPKRTRADYRAYYWQRCAKLAPRTRAWDNQAFEDVLALIMLDYPQKSEIDCVIALANMKLYAPVRGPMDNGEKPSRALLRPKAKTHRADEAPRLI